MQNFSEESLCRVKTVDFGCIPVDTVSEKYIYITNLTDKALTYRISLTYILNNIDRVFNVSVSSAPVKPGGTADVKIVFRPNVVGQSFTDYYIIDDTLGNTYRLTVTGMCFGPEVTLSRRKLKFKVCRNVDEQRKEVINMINTSPVDTTYQWLLPHGGQGSFQVSTGNCGLIRAFESITSTIIFNGIALGVYTAELVCLVLHQEPLFLNVVATVVLPANPLFDLNDHVFEKGFRHMSRTGHLMENSLNRLSYIPPASVFERYLDFGSGSVNDITKNISQTLCVTNHDPEEGYIQWISDPYNIFIIDPVAAVIPPNESKLFTVRFRPKLENEVYGYLMCGDYQQKIYSRDQRKLKHITFRIPCVGNTWAPCTEWTTEWDCPTEVVLPPTVPARTTFTNFMLSNRLDIPMYFKFEAPYGTNFAVMPMCGILPSRGWHIITVALEPKSFGDYYETWDLIINKVQKVRICLCGNAEISQVEIMSHGYNPNTHAMFEFQPTTTGATNYCTAYFHNITRMEIHMRVICHVSWLGADNCGTIVLPPKEIVRYHWWFFPKKPDLVYDTYVTCSCVCLIDGKPVGEPSELYVHIFGFSEYPNLRIIPKKKNLHDIVVGESVSVTLTLYNYGSCYYTSKLYYLINGMGDDWSGDRFEIDCPVNSLKPNKLCNVTFTVVPDGAGSRQIDIKYTVLFRTEYDEIEEIQPITKTICKIWYDGIYPTIKIKRTIAVVCPVIFSNHCVWNLSNVDDLNRALEECRPHEALSVTLFAPELCMRSGVVELIFVMGCLYNVPVPWSLRREKVCECEMVEVKLGLSTFEMRHTCHHRELVEISPLSGIVSKENPGMLSIKFNYKLEGLNTLCYVMTMPNQRVLHINVNIVAHLNTKGILTPLRRPKDDPDYLVVLDCGKVPINNLDAVIRVAWLYNPTDVFTTWRLLRGNTITVDTTIRCLLYFAEVPPLGKLAIPFAFMPTEMIDYDMTFLCSFGYDTEKIRVIGQGGLPNCVETRLDIPFYMEKVIRSAYRNEVVYLSTEHITMPIMATHSLSRDIISICNETDHIYRFIWLPERIANIVNIVMTPCWGVIQPKTSEWITMTVYTLQEPATFTTCVACELLDLTERRRYQRNELLRRNKIEKCHQEFIITEKGFFHPNINDSPPYVLDLVKPQPNYVALTVSVSSKGQRDGVPRMLLNQMWERTPPYDMLSSDENDFGMGDKASSENNMTSIDVLRIIDGILWDALHSKMFKNQIKYYAKEEIPTYSQLVKKLESDVKPRLSRRVTSGICDAIVNKAVFHVYGLNPKRDSSYLEAAEEEE
ncbi:cilia- and flagella-associated protein 65-like [Pectinophora gossypiella]|uniref:cilia- and flagella-associated protein 65-like n=1 Tax=Pectinophora gossypiella TaxID=13191 RepID=UPI00214F4CE5|nr:cilia- and flagella-associated protein 65-like [Pectinophora gossypiella]